MEIMEQIASEIQSLDAGAIQQARERQDNLTKPQGSLGTLEEIAVKVAGITGNPLPKIGQKTIIVMAGDHGVVNEGVSAYPQEVTPQMVYNFLSGGACINVLARHVGARVRVVDMGVATELEPHPELVNRKIALGTNNMAEGPAMSREEAQASIEAGMEVVQNEIRDGATIIGTGDMGIGNTSPSSAILAALTGQAVKKVVGRGTGINDHELKRKRETVGRALYVNKPDPKDPIDVLSKVGGFEIGGLAGCILGAAAQRTPVVIDGFISGAAALLASRIDHRALDYMIASHVSAESGHRIMLDLMGLKPLIHAGMRLGEGTGAALGISLIEAACKILSEMATFGEAGVSEAIE
jgi:nicotinate-nucleotide--dimethylbenzimidazole phosphoribosyltransferase